MLQILERKISIPGVKATREESALEGCGEINDVCWNNLVEAGVPCRLRVRAGGWEGGCSSLAAGCRADQARCEDVALSMSANFPR